MMMKPIIVGSPSKNLVRLDSTSNWNTGRWKLQTVRRIDKFLLSCMFAEFRSGNCGAFEMWLDTLFASSETKSVSNLELPLHQDSLMSRGLS